MHPVHLPPTGLQGDGAQEFQPVDLPAGPSRPARRGIPAARAGERQVQGLLWGIYGGNEYWI